MAEYATVLWTDTACQDLEAIVDYIAEDNPHNALVVLDRLEARVSTLVTNPWRGRLVPELRSLDLTQYRELIERPWRIIYRIESIAFWFSGLLGSMQSRAKLWCGYGR